ncbi:30S ribosomal protein S20 [Patescibacteria group bacterium]|nr:30S ribosomal protein S20 [Patescibacteria group bacterium]
MPIKQAAIKDLRKNHKRAAKNLRLKTHVKHLTRALTDLVKDGKASEAKTALAQLQQTLAKAAKTHILHNNNAQRKIASAFKLVNKK